MPEIDRQILTNLTAGSTDTNDSSPIPNGKIVMITAFGGADINLGDSKSSAYLLQWGTVGAFTDIAAIAFTGGTFEYKMNASFLGDGSKFFRIMRQNNSASNKRCPVWVKGFY